MDKLLQIASKGTQVVFLSESDRESDNVTDLGISKLPEIDGKPQMYSRQLFITAKDGEAEFGTVVYLMSTNKDVPVSGNIPIRLNRNNNWVGFIA